MRQPSLSSPLKGIYRNSDGSWVANIQASDIGAVARMSQDGHGYTVGPAARHVECECECGNKHKKVENLR